MKQYHSFVEFVKCTFSWSRKFVDSSKTESTNNNEITVFRIKWHGFFFTNLEISVTASV